MERSLFALERYESVGDAVVAPSLPADGVARLVAAIHLPADEVVLVLAEGPNEAAVTTALEAAGWRVDRVGPAIWLLPEGGLSSGPDRTDPLEEQQ